MGPRAQHVDKVSCVLGGHCLRNKYEANYDIILFGVEYTPEMYLVQGPRYIDIRLLCATFATMEPTFKGEKVTQRRAFQILWNLITYSRNVIYILGLN